MNLWFILILSLLALTGAGILFLAGRIGRFAFIRKLSGNRNALSYLLGLAAAILSTAIIWLSIGFMNAIVCMLHLVIFWIVWDVIFQIVQKRQKPESDRYYAGAVAVIITICYLASGWYQAHHVVATIYDVSTEKKVNSLRVAALSDSHVGTTFDGNTFARHLKTIEAQNPDLLLIVGDFVDDDTSKEDMIRSCEALGAVKTTYGVYFVFGNHDKGYSTSFRGYDGDDLRSELEKNGVHVMQDDVELVDDRFYVIGRKDRFDESRSGRMTMDELVTDLDPDKFKIVLDHQPQDYKAQAKAGVDLVISGHTHGGQLFPLMVIENLIKITPDDKVYGYEKRGDTNFIVTSGISDWAIKFKTGCKSEYLIVDIQNK